MTFKLFHIKHQILLSSSSSSFSYHQKNVAFYDFAICSSVYTIYWNFMLAPIPLSAKSPLQRMQNTSSCLVHNLSALSNVTPPLLSSLHWLPSRFLSLHSRYQKTPHYLCTHECQLRSSNSGQLTCPPLRSKHDCNAELLL